MADVRPPRSLSSVEGLQPVWDQFRGGGTAPCPNDAAPMALAVDGATETYRFVCVTCGHASPWFEARLAHLTIKGHLGTEPPGVGEE